MTLQSTRFFRMTLLIAAMIAAPLMVLGLEADPTQGQAQRAGQRAAQQQQQAQQQQMAQQQQQMTQQQQMAQQQRMAEMERTLERLRQLEQRATKMTERMAQRAGQSGTGPNGARDRSMRQLCDSVANLAGDMTRTMDRIHQSLEDPALIKDQDMLRDMDRLRLHVEDMAGPLEDAVKAMDRLQDRLHRPEEGR